MLSLCWMITFMLKVKELCHCLHLPYMVLREVDRVLWNEVGSLTVQTEASLLPLESPSTQSHFISFLPTHLTGVAYQFSVVLIPHYLPKFPSPDLTEVWGIFPSLPPPTFSLKQAYKMQRTSSSHQRLVPLKLAEWDVGQWFRFPSRVDSGWCTINYGVDLNPFYSFPLSFLWPWDKLYAHSLCLRTLLLLWFMAPVSLSCFEGLNFAPEE